MYESKESIVFDITPSYDTSNDNKLWLHVILSLRRIEIKANANVLAIK